MNKLPYIHIGTVEIYDKLKTGAQFIYYSGNPAFAGFGGFEYFGIKINDEYAAVVNRSGRFILAKRNERGFFINKKFNVEYDTFEEATRVAFGLPLAHPLAKKDPLWEDQTMSFAED